MKKEKTIQDMKRQTKRSRIISNIILTGNLFFVTAGVILDFFALWFWALSTFFMVAIWFEDLGWRRGFVAQQKIHRQIFGAFERVMKRANDEEIRLNTKEDFNKAFNDEMKLSKYYDGVNKK